MARAAGPRSWAVLTALLVLAALLYAPQLATPWVYEDANWLGAITVAPSAWNVPSRDLTMQTYHWTWQVAGLEPFAYRLGNFVLHLVNGTLIYATAAALIPGSAAVWAAGVFLLHPLNSEAASYATARADLLMTFGTLLAIVVALWQPQRGTGHAIRWASLLTGLSIAALSKEIGLVAGPLVWVTLLLLRPDDWLTRWGLLLIGTIALAVVQPALSAIVFGIEPHNSGGSSLTWPMFMLLQLTAAWHLLVLVAWPFGFSIDHDVIGLAPAWTVFAGLATVQAIALGLWAWRRAPLLAWGLAWGAVALAPRFLFRTNEFLHEYHLYVVVAGLSVPLGVGLSRLGAWRPPWPCVLQKVSV